MWLELIAALVAGLGAGGVAMLLRRISGKRLPGWLVPVAAGLAMIAYGIWSDYAWRDRTVAALPEGSVVLAEIPSPIWWKPWTLLAPPVERLSAVHAAGARTRDDRPGLVLAQVLLMARDAPRSPCRCWWTAGTAGAPTSPIPTSVPTGCPWTRTGGMRGRTSR